MSVHMPIVCVEEKYYTVGNCSILYISIVKPHAHLKIPFRIYGFGYRVIVINFGIKII